jgi:DNA polymerase-3 subunit alpha
LFGNSAEERSNGGNALELPPADEVSKRQKLSWERELLGIFVSDHPLSSYQDFIKNYSTPITQLNGDHDGKQARVSGIITKIHKILTRNGEQMIFATIEDMQKSMEAVVFPKKYADNSEIWHEDNVVMVEGKINNKDGALKILVDKVEEIGEQMTMIGQPLKAHNDNAFWRKKVEKPKKVIQNEIKKLYLSIPNQGSKEILSAIKEIILKYPGDHPVVLKLFTNGNSQMVETKTKVRLAKAMMNQLRELLGKSKVFIKSY